MFSAWSCAVYSRKDHTHARALCICAVQVLARYDHDGSGQLDEEEMQVCSLCARARRNVRAQALSLFSHVLHEMSRWHAHTYADTHTRAHTHTRTHTHTHTHTHTECLNIGSRRSRTGLNPNVWRRKRKKSNRSQWERMRLRVKARAKYEQRDRELER